MNNKNKNYYMQEQIGDSGVANTQNLVYLKDKRYEPFIVTPGKINVGEYFSSDSKYDESIGDLSSVTSGEKTVDDLRAEKQTGLDMFANALVNNVVIAGTTAIEGTLGLANSLFTLSWDNAINNWAADVQEATRESFPIYRGQEYEDKSLLEKMGTGVFWADLVQNLGYAEGMMIPGMGAAKLLTSAPKIVRNFVPSLVGSIGEASTEAIMAKRDEVENKTRIANEEYNKLAATATSPLSLSIIEAEYMDTLDNIEKDATKAGNFVFGSNVALLTMSNSIQFGNLFSRGFGTTKRLKGALKRKGDIYKTDNLGLSMALEGVKKIGQATTEGIEEVSQAIISNTPSNYTDYNSFNSSIFNPENRELAGNIWQALGQSYAETMQDSNTAVEFATGFIIGALGIPRLRMSKMPITIENNAGVELYNKYQEIKQQQELTDEINTRLEQNDKIKEYYNGLVRHLTIQDRMNIALDNQDAYEYKNAESAQFISDIMMFDNVGDLNNLKNIINNSVDFSDEGIDSIIQETSKNGEGPFMTNGNPLDRNIVRDIIKEKIDILNYKIDNYAKDKEALEVNYPDMDKETINNALFLRGQIRDHSDRYKDLLDKSYSSIKPLLDKDSAGGISTIDKNTFEVSWITSSKFREEISKVIDKDKATISFDEKQKVKQDLNDIVKIYDSLETMNKSLKDIITNPNKSKEDIQKNQEEAVKVDNDKKANDFITKASNATSFGEVSDIKTEAYIDDEILNKNNAQVVKDYKKASLYNNSINRVINSMDIEDDVKSNALQLFREQYYSSSTLDELMNPNSVILDNDNILYDDTLSEEDNMIKYQKARQAIFYAMNKVNSEESFKNQFSKEIPEASTEGVPSNNTPQNDITGNSETATVPSVNTKQQGESKVYEAPIGDRTIEQLEEENTNIQSAQEHLNEIKRGKLNNYYRPAIPELHIEASKEGDFRPFNVVVSERESGVNFDTIYNYLGDNGAFTYVNDGNLKLGTELGFMIDPNLEEQMKSYSWYKGPTILIIDKNNNQVVGSLDESEKSISRFQGLKELSDKIKQEYSNRDNKETSTFIASPTVKVSKIMVGKIPYTNTERSLAEIPNVQSEGKPAVFGIIKNGTLFTNGKIEDSKVVKPLDMSNKEGRMYLLIPNATGKYSPAAVRVKHYNRKEFNPSDVAVQNTKVFKNIQDAVRKLAESSNAEDLSLAVKDLSSSIYTGNLHIDWFDSPNGSGIKISKAERDSNGNEIYDEKYGKRVRREKTKWVYLTENDPNFLGSLIDNNTVVTGSIKKDLDSVIKVINTALLDLNLPIQVNAGIINSGGYNKMLIDSGVLTSNILDARVLGSWFTTDTFNAEEQLEKPTSPTATISSPTTNNNSPVGGIESISNKEVEYVKEELPESKESLSAEEIVKIEQDLDAVSDEFEDDLILLESKESIISSFNSKDYIPNIEYSIKDIKKVFDNSLYSSEMFTNIIDIAEQYGVTVTLLDRPLNDKTLGAYGYNKIFIYVSPNHPEFRHTLMHELIHSVTQKLLQHRGDLSAIQEDALDALENIFKYIKKNYISDEYGLNNMSEFLSELSNPAFRDFLKSITIDNKVSVWKKILGYIKRLLLGGEKVTALEISDSILENLLVEPIRDYSRVSQAPGRRKIINKNLSKEERDYILTSIERIMYRNKIIKQGYITLYNPNTKYFYEINIHPTEEGFEDLKQDIIGDGYQSVYRIPLKRNLETTVFNKLPSSIKTTLINKGWTQEKFDSISQQERDKAIECLSL